MKKNEVVRLNITDISSNGSGIGRIQGQVVFVPYALPFEEVEALIIKVTKNYCVGKLQKILVPSPFRCEPECKYFYRCGGCDLQHIDYKHQLEIKTQAAINNIRKISGLDLKIKEVIPCNYQFNYRNKAQLPVANGKNGEVLMGFFAPRSHNIIDIDSCMLQKEECNNAIMPIKKLIKKYGISVYNEVTHSGFLRHVVIRVGKKEKMLIFVTNGKNEFPKKFIDEIVSTLKFDTVIQNVNTKKGNIILGDECVTLYGSGVIHDQLCGIKFNLSPLAFLQVNTDQAERLYNIASDGAGITKNDIVFDAYCGIGIMSLLFAKKAKKVIGVEIIPQAIESAKISAEINGINNAEFFTGACEEILPKLMQDSKPDVLVVDPPRAGCDSALTQKIAELKIKKVVYISCDPATLARDIKLLCSQGYSCSDVTFVDMFANTKHIETVVFMSKEKE